MDTIQERDKMTMASIKAQLQEARNVIKFLSRGIKTHGAKRHAEEVNDGLLDLINGLDSVVTKRQLAKAH